MPSTPPKRAPDSAVERPRPIPAWEHRSTHRVLESGRDHLLERSRRIVAAAYALLKEEGQEGLTIRAVLRQTGLSRRAFYERFEGKDDLILAVFEETIRMAAERFREAIVPLADPVERLRYIVFSIVLSKEVVSESSLAQPNHRSTAMCREHLRLAESRPADLQAALKPLIALLAEQIGEGIAGGSIREGDAERMATLVYNLVSTTVQTELLMHESLYGNEAYKAQLAEDIWQFCRRALIRNEL